MKPLQKYVLLQSKLYFQPRSYFLQFPVGWQIRHLQTHLEYGSCNLHILVAIKIAMKKLRVVRMLLEKKMLLCCYSVEKHVMENTLDCHINFETVVEISLLVLDFVSLYNFVGNCETTNFYVLQVLLRTHWSSLLPFLILKFMNI